MKTIRVRIRGSQPLMLHNVRLANPLDPHTQALSELTKKRKKTLDDHKLISKLEFEGGLYHDETEGPYLTDGHLLKCIQEGAKKEKLGKAMKSAIFIRTGVNPLVYKGPRDIKGLYAGGFYDQRCVGVQKSKTVRTRPRFYNWSVEFSIQYDETLVDPMQIKRAIVHAGKVEGLGDYRPRYGTFELESFDE